MALIKLENITKVYSQGKPVKALDGLDLEIEKGQFTAVQGSSGSGKSTLLNILGLLDHPTKGEYFLAGKNTKKFSKNNLNNLRNKEIGFIFQTFNLLSRLSALENTALPLVYKKGEINWQKAEEILKKIGLGKRINHRPNQLSGGEKQRVAIGRALVNEPSLILADEPTGNLDSKTGEKIMDLITKIYEKRDLTIILVTHEDNIAKYANRKVILKDGKIAEKQ